MDDLRAGRIARIGGDTIDAACDASGMTKHMSPRARERVYYMTTRMVVELACKAQAPANGT